MIPPTEHLFVVQHRIRLRPRYLKDVSKVDMRTTIQGAEISAPICIAPTGFHRLAWPDGEMSTARGMSCPHLEAPLPRPFRCADMSFRAGATSFSMEDAYGHEPGWNQG